MLAKGHLHNVLINSLHSFLAISNHVISADKYKERHLYKGDWLFGRSLYGGMEAIRFTTVLNTEVD